MNAANGHHEHEGRNGHAGASGAHDAPALRVILVGRTGLDGALRTDPRIELVRAANGPLAVGELFSPIDALTPGLCAVIVGDGADPGPDASRFVGALKSIDPRVRVLRVVNGRAPMSSAPYDGTVSESAGAQGVLDAASGMARTDAPIASAAPVVVNGFAPGTPVATPPVASPVRRAAPVHTAMPAAPAPQHAPIERAAVQTTTVLSGTIDEQLVHAAIASREVLPAALEAIRARLGRPDVLFHAATPGVPVTGSGTPVRYREHVFGHLIASGVNASALDEQARWLGAWLALQRQHQQLVDAAMTDDLTGAWNRRYFDRYMKSAIAQAQATRQPLVLMVFDIDDFKQYNDQFGHLAGDEILKHTVALLNSVIRAGDKVCRIGGDEFAVIFFSPDGPRDPSSKPPAEVRTIARRFQEQVLAARFPKLGKEAPGRLGVSGGLATFPWDGRTAEELLAHADALACQCKQQGKGQIILGPDAEQTTL